MAEEELKEVEGQLRDDLSSDDSEEGADTEPKAAASKSVVRTNEVSSSGMSVFEMEQIIEQ